MSFESEVKAVVFTNPQSSGRNHITLLEDLINNTPAKEDIYVCISHFNHHTIADALIAAGERGVSVRMIMEAAESNGNEEIREYFQEHDRNSKVQITMAHGCYGTRNHIKLFLFSRTKLAKLDREEISHVAVAGSATITEGSLHKHQNMFVVADEPFYEGLFAHWVQMLVRANFNGDEETEIADVDLFSTSTRIKAYLFPRSADPVPRIINNVKGANHKDTGARPRIRIAMARWTNAASRKNISSAIMRGLSRGCIVDLVLRRDTNEEDGTDDGVSASIINFFSYVKRQYFPSTLFIHVGRIDRDEENIHSKYLLVEGYYGEGPEWETNVWSGSENWTGRALTSNDEITVKFRDARVYKLFVDNHNLLKSLCKEL